jgi:diguanylate cyclase (GGDEF)-like protein
VKLRVISGAIARLRGEGPVWLLTAAMSVGAVVLCLLVVRHIDPPTADLRIPWWALALGFAAAEVFVVHVTVRHSALSLSLAELPLVAGLFLSLPSDLLLAAVAGPAVVLLLDRRHNLMRTSFNLAQFALVGGLSITVFNLLRPEAVDVGPVSWIAAVAATLTGTLVAGGLIAAGMSLAEEPVGWRQLARMLTSDGLVAIANTCLALAGVAVLLADPRSAWLLLGPAIVMFLAYRAFIRERSRHQSLEFLYTVTRTVNRAPTVEAALSELLDRTREAFHAQLAEICLFGEDGESALVSSVSADGHAVAMQPISGRGASDLLAAVRRHGPMLIDPERAQERGLGDWLSSRGLHEALVAPLIAEEGLIGVISLGDRLGRVTEFSRADLTLLETLANHAAVSLEHDRLEQAVGQLTELRDRLEHRASHDSLTGLANGALFADSVAEALLVPGGRVAVLFLDLDDFKRVNDRFGHETGDELLVAFTRRLRSCLRGTDLPARLGGDEFAVLLERGDHERATRIAERIQLAFREPFKLASATLRVQASTGIAIGEGGVVGAAELMRNADLAMYAAKEQDKGRFEVFDDRQAAPLLRRNALTDELEQIVDRRGLEVSYQPIVELATGRVVGAEALARWHREDGEDISPTEFIPLAERSGLIVPIGELVQARACAQLLRWERSVASPGLVMHVNVSSAELRDPELVPRVAGVVEDAGIDPRRLVLEVTETALLEDARLAVDQLERLRAMGVRVAIDDFGTGYSSLHTLQRLPIDILKMAKPFVDEAGLAFQTTILQLAGALGVEVVAEGIENDAQLARLRDLGCQMGQGFYLSSPLSPTALLDWTGPSLPQAGESIGEFDRRSQDERDLTAA